MGLNGPYTPCASLQSPDPIHSMRSFGTLLATITIAQEALRLAPSHSNDHTRFVDAHRRRSSHAHALVFPSFRDPSAMTKPVSLRLWIFAVASWLISTQHGFSAEPLSQAQRDFFESRIRPILVNECQECHGATQQKGGLRLDSSEALRKGGDSGPVLFLDPSRESPLLLRLRDESDRFRMPKDRPRLPARVIADIEQWIRDGAPDPRTALPSASSLTSESTSAWDATVEMRRDWWSFKPIRRPTLPPISTSARSQHPVDRFIAVQLDSKGLKPSPPADRSSQLRRLSFVLTGLPPTPEELESFLTHPSPLAYEHAVDRLLASPRFGERWARHWMDLVRYSESHGSQGDPELPMAWRYRDYLVRAFNQDLPYRQLLREHLAGDLLPHPRIQPADSLNESRLGTAHWRMVEHGYIPVDSLDDQIKVIDNQIDVFSKAFLGLTIACARCHDHKFDPISQRDFYALYGVFASCRPGQIIIDEPNTDATPRARMAELKQQIRKGLTRAWSERADHFAQDLLQITARSTEHQRLDRKIEEFQQELSQIEFQVRARLNPSKPNNRPLQPVSRWTFERDFRDEVGSLHGSPTNGAHLRHGRLVLNGTNAWVTTEPFAKDLNQKTLEAWVVIRGLDQRGGGVLTTQSLDSERFDSIVLGEREPGHWIAGSDFFRRTQDVGAPAETALAGQLVHLAITYAADGTITLFRDGQPYGKPYRPGVLQPFPALLSRVVFGKRHLSPGVSAFAGEIEEARLYDRALSAAEIADSFHAGFTTVPLESLIKAFTNVESERWEFLNRSLAETQRLRDALPALSPTSQALSRLLTAAVSDPSNPLHPWSQLHSLEGNSLGARWEQLIRDRSLERSTLEAFNREKFPNRWRVPDDPTTPWYTANAQSTGAMAPPTAAGDFLVEPTGEHIFGQLFPTCLSSGSLSRKDGAVVSSPRFRIDTRFVSLRVFGEHAVARTVIDNYAIGNGGLYPSSIIDARIPTWIRLDTAYRKGSQAYVELATSEDFPNSGMRSGGRPMVDGRAHFGILEVAFHDDPESPKPIERPPDLVLQGAAPKNATDLAERFASVLNGALHHWQSQKLSPLEVEFLNAFIQAGVLPTSTNDLAGIAPSVATFRTLEHSLRIPRRAPGLHEALAFDQPLFKRGVPSQPSTPVPRAAPSFLGGHSFTNTQSGRLELAEFLVHPSNPLTARVMANRIWLHVFGRGLVGTPDNFGRLGEAPTHPELLDFLAFEFQQNGGSLKSLLRLLVTSDTFRQSAHPSPEATRLDPANTSLSHARVRRLEAEAIRDAILIVSGELDERRYGPGINVYYTGKSEGGGPKGPLDGEGRRSLYQRIRRNAHNPFLEAFDAPKPASTRGRRDVTNVPGQSLTLLNDPFVIEHSTRWARKVIREGAPARARIESMIIRALGRPASAEDSDFWLHYVTELAGQHSVRPDQLSANEAVWRDFAHSLFCLKEFIYVD